MTRGSLCGPNGDAIKSRLYAQFSIACISVPFLEFAIFLYKKLIKYVYFISIYTHL